jgi:DNA-binding MarR family transcriptional regulator
VRLERVESRASEIAVMLKNELFIQPGHLIRRAHQRAWAMFVADTREVELTPVQYSALLAISFHPGIDATRMSELISYDRATLGNVVERMETRGYLTRRANAKDRRTKKMVLTARGQAAVDRVRQMAPRIADEILSPLTERERIQLIALLSKLVGIAQVIEAEGTASQAIVSAKPR